MLARFKLFNFLQGIYKDIAPGISLADELIQERHRESQL